MQSLIDVYKRQVYTKATASVVKNDSTNKSYPSLEQAMAEAGSGTKLKLDVYKRQAQQRTEVWQRHR